MKTKTTKTTTTTPAEPYTPAMALTEIKKHLGRFTQKARKDLLEATTRMQMAPTEVANALANESPEAGMSAANVLLQAYWPMRDAAEAAGQLKVYEHANKILADLEAKFADADQILVKFQRKTTRMAIDDSSRTESSSNAFSNAFSNAGGEGRGKAYRDLADIIDCYTDSL